MPKELTHWILAECAFKKLDCKSKLGNIISKYKNEYLAGAVLPDTLLHVFKGPYAKSALDAASRFHDAVGNSYEPIIHAELECQQSFSEPMISCLMGVISHMQTDIAFHPFVYALAGTEDIGRHYQLETDIDLYFNFKRSLPPTKRLVDLMNTETEQILVSVIEILFTANTELPRIAILKALRLHSRFQSMYSSTFWKLVVNLLGAFPCLPFNNQRHLFYPVNFFKDKYLDGVVKTAVWKHPVTGELKNKTVDDLAEDAVKQTVSVFNRIEAAPTLAAALVEPPGCNLLTGMYAVNRNKMFMYCSS